MPEYSQIRTSERDAVSAAMVLINEARRDIEEGWHHDTDMKLYVAQQLLLSGGAKDIGPLTEPRDFADDEELRGDLVEEINTLKDELEHRDDDDEQEEDDSMMDGWERFTAKFNHTE